jgi:hypothetical protein
MLETTVPASIIKTLNPGKRCICYNNPEMERTIPFPLSDRNQRDEQQGLKHVPRLMKDP